MSVHPHGRSSATGLTLTQMPRLLPTGCFSAGIPCIASCLLALELLHLPARSRVAGCLQQGQGRMFTHAPTCYCRDAIRFRMWTLAEFARGYHSQRATRHNPRYHAGQNSDGRGKRPGRTQCTQSGPHPLTCLLHSTCTLCATVGIIGDHGCNWMTDRWSCMSGQY